tara:strand:+ start:3332 stop:3748 length:417 start_codon:yes stop_codon:yes gene_type:complete
MPIQTIRNLFKSPVSNLTRVDPSGPFVPGGGPNAAEWFNLPTIACLTAAALLWREASKTAASKVVESKMTCDEKYCPPTFQIHVDKPVNTLLKDQSEGGALSGPTPLSLAIPYARVKSDYYNEAVQSPGVKLVAHAVA